MSYPEIGRLLNDSPLTVRAIVERSAHDQDDAISRVVEGFLHPTGEDSGRRGFRERFSTPRDGSLEAGSVEDGETIHRGGINFDPFYWSFAVSVLHALNAYKCDDFFYFRRFLSYMELKYGGAILERIAPHAGVVEGKTQSRSLQLFSKPPPDT